MNSLTDSNVARGILLICIGVFAISINDMLIKALSGGYPLHQIVFTRSLIGLTFTLFFLRFEGGWRILRSDTPLLHVLRGLLALGRLAEGRLEIDHVAQQDLLVHQLVAPDRD